MIEGGCLCGAVRYRAKGSPVLQAVCHCRNCQRQSGTPFSVVVAVEADSLQVEGKLKVYVDHGASGNEVLRRFCPDCGSPISSELPASSGIIYLKAGTLDDVSAIAPKVHVWCDSAWPTSLIPEGSTRYAQNPG